MTPTKKRKKSLTNSLTDRQTDRQTDEGFFLSEACKRLRLVGGFTYWSLWLLSFSAAAAAAVIVAVIPAAVAVDSAARLSPKQRFDLLLLLLLLLQLLLFQRDDGSMARERRRGELGASASSSSRLWLSRLQSGSSIASMLPGSDSCCDPFPFVPKTIYRVGGDACYLSNPLGNCAWKIILNRAS